MTTAIDDPTDDLTARVEARFGPMRTIESIYHTNRNRTYAVLSCGHKCRVGYTESDLRSSRYYGNILENNCWHCREKS